MTASRTAFMIQRGGTGRVSPASSRALFSTQLNQTHQAGRVAKSVGAPFCCGHAATTSATDPAIAELT
jgi:hypothetical protein